VPPIKEPARMFVMQNILMLRAIHFSIGYFPLVEFFLLKAASSRMSAISIFLTLVIAISDQLQYYDNISSNIFHL
jgi:hypothetical protein